MFAMGGGDGTSGPRPPGAPGRRRHPGQGTVSGSGAGQGRMGSRHVTALANCYLALEHDLEIVAALNKIDLPAADPDRYAAEIEQVLGIPASSILRLSAKTGEGVPQLLDAVCERIPPPAGDPDAALQALIFDSSYDQYRGVVSSVRVVNGTMTAGSRVRFMQAATTHDVEEIGVRTPSTMPVAALGVGEVGYLIAGIKDVGEARSGETVTEAGRRAAEPLPGYMDPKPMVL